MTAAAHDNAVQSPASPGQPVKLKRRPDSVYTVKQWEQLDSDLFGDIKLGTVVHEAGESLKQVKKFAESQTLAPVAVLALAIMQVCASVPAGTTFDAGLGPGSLNQLLAIVGRPGSGKDRHWLAVSNALQVVYNQRPVEVVKLAPGSGEGMVEALKPDDDGISHPTVFSMSEVGTLNELMGRKGSTLRGTLLSMYSGNALGFANKNERTYIEANSYVSGLWVGTQPDKAGALLDGGDDGLSHRFLWFEPINPLLAEQLESSSHNDHMEPVDGLRTVMLPDDIRSTGITFHCNIRDDTVRAGQETVAYGPADNSGGHRNQTRLKVAAGMALLASRSLVDLEDWYRAGKLMDYSDAVRRRCEQHLEDRDVEESAKQQERQQRADDKVHQRRIDRNKKRILEALADNSSEEAVQWSPLMRKRPSRERGSMMDALEILEAEGAVGIIKNADCEVESLTCGSNFNLVCDSVGVSHLSPEATAGQE